MATVIDPATTKTITKQREIFRIEIDVNGTQAAPIYTVIGHCIIVYRDATGAEVGRIEGARPVQIDHARLTAGQKTTLANLVNLLDGEPVTL